MGSWSFLIKRIIHTVITLLIVLILLFVIFRLMPGDPAKFFIKPGMREEAYHLIAVRYGFEKEELAPGNRYEVKKIDTKLSGAYGLKINVTDDIGNKALYYGSHNIMGILKVDDNTSVYNVSISPQQPALGEQVTINLELLCDASCPSQFLLNLTHEGGVFEAFTLPKGPTEIIGSQEKAEYTGTTTGGISDAGNYYVSFDTLDDDGNQISNVYGFSINKSPEELKPFTVENLQIIEIAPAQSTVTASIASTTNVKRANLTANSPQNIVNKYSMIRGTVFVSVPYWEQFVIYMKNMLSFDFGESFVSGRPVWSELSQRIPPTLLLFGLGLIISAVLGILFGALMAWRRGTKGELAGIILSLFFYSMPIFWFGLILLAVFAFQLGWFPLRGMLSPGEHYEGLAYVADLLWHLTLPLITLTVLHLAGWLLLMRNSMLEVMGEDYITTAKAKGLTDRKVMYKHAARNAMLPVVTAIALSIGYVAIGGGVLTETIFAWPGMGQYLVYSTFARDYPAVQGAFFLLAIMVIFANLIADLLYAYLDPRVRLSR